MNAVTVEKIETSIDIDFSQLFQNALNCLSNEASRAREVFKIATENLCYYNKNLELVNEYEKARMFYLYEKIMNGGVVSSITETQYNKLKTDLQSYGYTWLRGLPIQAAESKIERLGLVNPKTQSQAQVLMTIDQIVSFHHKELHRYTTYALNDVVSVQSTLPLREFKMLTAADFLAVSSSRKLFENVQELSKQQLMLILLDAAKRLEEAVATASNNLAKAHATGPFASCDKVAKEVGYLKSLLNIVKFSGIRHDLKKWNTLEQSIHTETDICLKIVRGSKIDGARSVLDSIYSIINYSLSFKLDNWLSDITENQKTYSWLSGLSFEELQKLSENVKESSEIDFELTSKLIGQMQNHRTFLGYYNDVEFLTKKMQVINSWSESFKKGSLRYCQVYNFVKEFI